MDIKSSEMSDNARSLFEALSKVNTILLPIAIAGGMGILAELRSGISKNRESISSNEQTIEVNREAFEGQTKLIVSEIKLLIREHEADEGHSALSTRLKSTDAAIMRIEKIIENLNETIQNRMSD